LGTAESSSSSWIVISSLSESESKSDSDTESIKFKEAYFEKKFNELSSSACSFIRGKLRVTVTPFYS
jgi:hypothetical protein